MRIGIDVTCWGLQRGFGRHTRCLLGALLKLDSPHHFTLFASSESQAGEFSDEVEIVVVPGFDNSGGGAGRAVNNIFRVSWAMSRHPIDVLFFPSSFSFVPVWTRASKLVMFHDVTGFLYPQLVFGNWKDRLLWRLKYSLARRQADRILTVSEHSQLGLARQFGLAEQEIHVVGEAADPIFRMLNSPELSPVLREAGLREGRRYLVYLGGFGPLKNLNRLVAAFSAVANREGISDVDLVMVGTYEKEAFYSTGRELVEMVKEQGLDQRVIFTGFLPDEEMVTLFNIAEAVALVSYNEGFGLPAVEAAACGCPSVATISSPLPSLLGEGGLFVDPLSVDEIAEGLWTVLSDSQRRARMSEAALEAASHLSWEKAATRMLELLEELN